MDSLFPEPRKHLPPSNLPQPTFDLVPLHHSVSKVRNHNAGPRSRSLRRQKEDVQVRRLLPLPISEKLPDVPGPGDADCRGEPESARRPLTRARPTHRSYFEPTDTTKRRRPLWRRRLRVFRPPFVSIRARNPCLFFRLRFRGLYVGIMASHPPDTWLRSKISFQRYQPSPGRVNPETPFPPWSCLRCHGVRLTFPHSWNSLPPPDFGRSLLVFRIGIPFGSPPLRSTAASSGTRPLRLYFETIHPGIHGAHGF